MATSAALPAPRLPKRPFASYHPWDRNFFLLYVVLIWAAILGGFVPEIVRHYLKGAPPQPWMVRLHGTAFVGWLVLLTTQVLLIRKRKVRLHRRIGISGAVLAGLMVLLGIGAALTQGKVVFLGAAVVAVAGNQNVDLRILRQPTGLPIKG